MYSGKIVVDLTGYTCHDITERKQAEEELKLFELMVENANDIVYTLTPDGVFQYVSPNWTEILGHEISEVAGKPFTPFVHEDDLQPCFDFLSQIMTTGQGRGIEYRVKHKDGSWRWHTSNASKFINQKGVSIYLGIAHDITERNARGSFSIIARTL